MKKLLFKFWEATKGYFYGFIIIGILIILGFNNLPEKGDNKKGEDISTSKGEENISQITASFSGKMVNSGSNEIKEDLVKILQDANFRVSPGLKGEIMRPLIKGEYVIIISDKKVDGLTWYNVSQKGVKGWISYLAFIDDPSKASAGDCDPVNGYIDEKGYCTCKVGYEWSRETKSCLSKYPITPVTQSTYTPIYYPTTSYSNAYGGSECIGDCSGHQAGYDWAEDKGISNSDDCGGNSNSFIEGCEEYVEDEYDGCNEGDDCDDIDSYVDCDSSSYCSDNLQ